MERQPTLIVPNRRSGRPARAGVRATKRVEFVATVSERRNLGQVARECGKPVATLVREAVNEYVADYRDKLVFLQK